MIDLPPLSPPPGAVPPRIAARRLPYPSPAAARIRGPADCVGLVLLIGDGPAAASDAQVARRLHAAGFATLDLAGAPAATGRAVSQLARRAAREPEARGRPVGVYAAGTMAGAAVAAAAAEPRIIGGLVLRSPDLPAGDRLPAGVAVPLLIASARDDGAGIGAGRRLAAAVTGPHRLLVVPQRPGTLWSPGALDVVGALAASWFRRHLLARGRRAAA